ncbi:MAG: MFS transporter [Proteobacteria bacterium]|nr:MFS transporter [Pseudomonadota bacterium]
MNRSARLYYSSVFSTNLGNSIHFIVSGKLLFDFSGLVGAFAGLVVLEHIKSVTLSAYAGVVTDRYSGSRVAVVSDLVLAMVGLLVTTALFVGLPDAWAAAVTAIGAFFINAAKPFYRVSTFAMVRSIAPEEKYFEFNTRAAFFQQAGYVLGLLVAGVLLNYFRPTTILYIDAASYLFSALCLAKASSNVTAQTSGIRSSHDKRFENGSSVVDVGRAQVAGKSFLRELAEVFRFCRTRKDVAWLVFSIAKLIVLLDLYSIFLFKLVGERFSSTPSALPLFEGIYAGGIAFLTVMTDRFSWFRQMLPSPSVSLIILALVFICIGQSSNLPMTACCVALMSVVFSSLFSKTTSKLYASIPNEISGRIGGFRGITLGLVGVPVVAVGTFFADRVSLQSAYIFAAALALLLWLPISAALNDGARKAAI